MGHEFHSPFSNKAAHTATETTPAWGCRRLTQSEFERVAMPSPCGQYYRATDAEGNSGCTRLLRPRKERPVSITEEYLQRQKRDAHCSEMRLLQNAKICHMWNEAAEQHEKYTGRCYEPQFCIYKEIKKGLCWKQSLKCINCSYTGSLHKLYAEVPSVSRGAKTAAPNLGWQVGLQETTMGNTKARVLLAAANVPPPSKKSMDRSAVKVSTLTSAAIEQDLSKERLKLKETSALRGLEADAPINVSIDGRYNSTVIAGRYKAGQNASQAISIAVENHTAQKKVVAAYIENKLCWTGSWLRNRGFAVYCPGGHEGCTATIAGTETLSELRMGEKIGDMFAADQVLVKYVTTDGDARTAEGVQAAMRKLFPEWQVVRKADPVHLGQSQMRHTIASTFSVEMFSGRTREVKREQQRTLALDMKSRCHAIFHKLFVETGGNMEKIRRRMPGVLTATVACYSGDCSHCRKTSVVCDGGARKNWWQKSCHLSTGVLHRHMLAPTEEDKQLLKELLRIKLGEAALLLLNQNTSTCKNEAINRSLSASLPKNVNWSRTGRGRMLATCDRINKGIGESLLHKLEVVGAPVTKGGAVARAVHRFQLDSHYDRAYKKRASVRKRIKCAKFRQRRHYHAAKAARVSKRDAYIRGQLDPRVDHKCLQATQRQHQVEQLQHLRQIKQSSRSSRAAKKAALQKLKSSDHTYAYDFRCKTDHTYAQ